jgi:hypothetical protein
MSDNSEPERAPQATKQKIILEITKRLKNAEEAQTAASQFRQHANEVDDPEEKRKAVEEAVKEEKKAKNELKIAQRLQSGVWQGGSSGAGIGAGVGMGTGTVVGALVGGVTAIPTTGLGLLVGAGTGAIHGPWVKLGNDGKKEETEGERKKASQENGG